LTLDDLDAYSNSPAGVLVGKGLGLIPVAGIVDSMFNGGGNIGRLAVAMAATHTTLGWGIGEDTVAVMQNTQMTVLGPPYAESVMVLDFTNTLPTNIDTLVADGGFRASGIQLSYLQAGDVYDMANRTYTMNPARTDVGVQTDDPAPAISRLFSYNAVYDTLTGVQDRGPDAYATAVDMQIGVGGFPALGSTTTQVGTLWHFYAVMDAGVQEPTTSLYGIVEGWPQYGFTNVRVDIQPFSVTYQY
jgi:hypothetical protein